MSRADKLFVKNIKDILKHGVLDTDKDVRPKWKDGTPAHTIKKFCVVNRYDLSKEFPIITIRKTNYKNCNQTCFFGELFKFNWIRSFYK